MKQFLAFRLDTLNQCLWRGNAEGDSGQRILLTPKAFSVLQYLVGQAGRLVSQDELLNAVWPDAHVQPEVLKYQVADIRSALGDNAKSPMYIETLPRRGYRFVAPVTETPIDRVSSADNNISGELVSLSRVGLNQQAGTGPQGDTLPGIEGQIDELEGRAATRQWRKAAVICASAVVLVALGYASRGHFRDVTRPRTEKIMLAVLPFENLTGDPNKKYLADGLTEGTISQLGRLDPEQLGVIARTSVMGYKHDGERLDQIGRDLSVQYVLENSLQQTGDHMRITSRLLQVKDRIPLWSQDYQYPANDIPNVEDDLAKAVAREFQIHLTSQQQAELSQPRRLNPEAFDAYMKGYYFFQRGADDKDTNMALTYFERATQLDPSYGLAWVGLSRTRYWQANVGLIPTQEGQQLARDAVERALTLDPNLPEANIQMGRIKRQVDFDWAGANSSIQRAIALEPGVPENLGQAAFMAQLFGRFDEALRLDREAVELDPLNAESWERLAENRFFAGQLDEAIADIKKALELNPDTWASHILLSDIYVLQGRPQDAQRAGELITSTLLRIRARAIAYSALGREKESDAALKELIEKYHASAACSIATVYAVRNQRDEAFKWLDRAYVQRDGGLIFIKINPLWKNLHGDPRYAALLKKLHLPN